MTILYIEMYRIFQFFVLCLKVNIFTEFLVSLFYLIQYAKEAGIQNTIKQADTWVQIVVTVLMLPFLYFARTAGSTESKVRMVIFIIFQFLVIAHFCIILKDTFQPENNWYTWIVFSKLLLFLYLNNTNTSYSHHGYSYRHHYHCAWFPLHEKLWSGPSTLCSKRCSK